MGLTGHLPPPPPECAPLEAYIYQCIGAALPPLVSPTHHENAALKGGQALDKRIDGVDVEVIAWFVQEQDVGLGEGQLQGGSSNRGKGWLSEGH